MIVWNKLLNIFSIIGFVEVEVFVWNLVVKYIDFFVVLFLVNIRWFLVFNFVCYFGLIILVLVFLIIKVGLLILFFGCRFFFK